jgi:transcriptional regulator with XRE-family HTH domain
MTNANFIDWIKKEIDKRGWTQAELARQTKLSPSQITRLFNGERGVGETGLVAIAHAFRLPANLVFEKAGILPPTQELKELSAKKRELLANLENADDNTVQFVIDMLEVAVKNKQRQVPSGTEIKTNPRLL